jgi:serine/threonine protein kinase
MSAPAEIGPYRVMRPLGHGGMGAVYLAHDTRLNRQVALKIFAGGDARGELARLELLNEARAAAALNHPNIASVHDVVDLDGQVTIVFEYVAGETLAARLQRGPLDAAETTGLPFSLPMLLRPRISTASCTAT